VHNYVEGKEADWFDAIAWGWIRYLRVFFITIIDVLPPLMDYWSPRICQRSILCLVCCSWLYC